MSIHCYKCQKNNINIAVPNQCEIIGREKKYMCVSCYTDELQESLDDTITLFQQQSKKLLTIEEKYQLLHDIYCDYKKILIEKGFTQSIYDIETKYESQLELLNPIGNM